MDSSPASAVRLVVDPPAAGEWNMAVDEALLESAAAGQATLRLYAWNPATLSLGYFQRLADRATHPASAGCPVVRRESGGGAIVHDRELTYSLALPVEHPWAREAAGLYRLLHQSLAEVLTRQGIPARLRSEAEVVRPTQEPFLCFLRQTAGDLLVGPHKVGGSAQRRRAGAILQHGSLLLGRSPSAPELPGLAELGWAGSGPAELVEPWLVSLEKLGGFGFHQAPLTQIEGVAVNRWHAARFTDPSWTASR